MNENHSGTIQGSYGRRFWQVLEMSEANKEGGSVTKVVTIEKLLGGSVNHNPLRNLVEPIGIEPTTS